MFGLVSVHSDAFQVFLHPKRAVSKHLLHASLHREGSCPKGQRMKGQFPLNRVVDFAGLASRGHEAVLMVPSPERPLLHHVVKHLAGHHIVMTSDPHGTERPKLNAKLRLGVIHQGACLNRTDAFPFGHDATEGTGAVVPRPNILHRSIVSGYMLVDGHEKSSLVG